MEENYKYFSISDSLQNQYYCVWKYFSKPVGHRFIKLNNIASVCVFSIDSALSVV